jgi:hypothetical protein
VYFQQAAASELAQPLERGVHRWSHFCLAHRSEIVQELLSGVDAISGELGRVTVPLRHRRQ